MDLKETKKELLRLEKRSIKNSYYGDASKWAFFRHALILLAEIANIKKRKPSAWNEFTARYLKEGKTIKEAAEAWKKRK